MLRVEISELSDEYLYCRNLGHSWDDFPSGEVESDLYKLAFAVEVVRCVRCTMERYTYLNSDLMPFQRYYRKPPRYDTVVGQGKRPNVRDELLRRSLLLRASSHRRGHRNGK